LFRTFIAKIKCVKVGALFEEHEVRFARAEQLWLLANRKTHHGWVHVFFEVSATEPTIPIIGDVTAVHNFTKQIAQIFPRDLRVGFQIVVQNIDADCQVANVERIGSVPALRTELSSLADDSVEVAQ